MITQKQRNDLAAHACWLIDGDLGGGEPLQRTARNIRAALATIEEQAQQIEALQDKLDIMEAAERGL